MRSALLLCAGLSLLLAGCGADYYENRLQATVDQFRYYEKLNSNLGPRAETVGGVQIRIPQGYQLIPGPPPPPEPETNEDSEAANESGLEEEAAPVEDPRQPEFLADDVELPGIAGAWETPVTLRGGGKATAYFYILSNYDLWLEEGQGDTASKFHDVAVEKLAYGFGVGVQPDQWRTLQLPTSPSYVEPKRYTATTLDPPPKIDDVPHEVSVYLLKSRDNQAVFLSIVPTEATSYKQLREGVLLALETAKLSETRPKAATEQPARGAGTAF